MTGHGRMLRRASHHIVENIRRLSPCSEARRQYSATDEVKKVIKDEKLDVDPHKAVDLQQPFRRHRKRLGYYTPENATKDPGLPMIVYFRGGGWVIADLDTYDASASALARKANAIVASSITRWRLIFLSVQLIAAALANTWGRLRPFITSYFKAAIWLPDR
jgi:acetyl esterase/lipase